MFENASFFLLPYLHRQGQTLTSAIGTSTEFFLCHFVRSQNAVAPDHLTKFFFVVRFGHPYLRKPHVTTLSYTG